MPQTRRGSNGDRRPDEERDEDPEPDSQRQQGGTSPTEWFAGTAIRAGPTLIGVVLLLFALGQAVGLPLLELATSALTTRTGQ